jgi:poly-gamma-glutamate capsule biosynthesis protein CapA/YwtB (metallophosphatase superfamily)
MWCLLILNWRLLTRERVSRAKTAIFLSPPGAPESLKTIGFNLLSLSNNHSFDLKIPVIQNTLEQVTRLNLAHAGMGNTIDEAVAPGYLMTPKGAVALVSMASGLIEAGGSATATRPGVNELHVHVEENKPNEEDSQRILQSIRDASKKADLYDRGKRKVLNLPRRNFPLAAPNGR